MLPSADRALARRDPELPGLGLVLDEEELGTWLTMATREPTRLRSHYLRYKHATSCVLAGHLERPGPGAPRPCLVSAYTGADIAKLSKTLERAPRGSVLAVDPTTGLVATTPGADRDLPALARLDDDARRGRLLRSVLGDRHGLRRADVQTVRHNPHRRWVGVVRLGDGPVVLRVYRPAEAQPAVDAIESCARLDVPTPRLLGADTRHGVAAVEYVGGEVLTRLAQSTAAEALEGFRAGGAALARLHRSPDAGLRSPRRAGDAHAVHAAVTQLAVLLPEQADDTRQLASMLAERLRELEPVRVPVHGDFSADQVVVDASGQAWLIDLDSAALGDPASDLACATAALVREVVLGTVDDDTAAAYRQALQDGYTTVASAPAEQRVAVLEAAHLFRRAVEPFRLRRTPNWPEAAREMLARARRAVVSDRTLMGRVR